MKCKNCGKEVDVLEEYCDECKQVAIQEELNVLIEENKELNKLENTKELDELSNLKEELIEENDLKKELKDIVKIDEEEIKSNKTNNKLIIVICTIIIVLLIIIIFLLLSKKETKESEEIIINYKEIINEYGDKVKQVVSNLKIDETTIPTWNVVNKLISYDEYKVECNIHDIYIDGNIYLDECKVNNKKIKYSYGEKQEKEEGKKINIYKQVDLDNSNYYNTIESELLVGTVTCKTMECEFVEAYEKYVVIKEADENYIYNYEEYSLEYGPFDSDKDFLIAYENNLYAIVYNTNNIYNFKTKKTIENLEGNFLAPEYGLNSQILYNYGYIIFKNGNINNFINLKTGNISYSINGEINNLVESIDKKIVYITTINSKNSKITIYNSNGKKLFNGEEYNRLILLDKSIIVLNDSNYYIYDLNLNLEFTSKTYDKILDVYNLKYIVAINDNYLSILDFKDNVLAAFNFEWDENIHTFLNEQSKINIDNNEIILSIEEKKETSSVIYEYLYNYKTNEISSKIN